MCWKYVRCVVMEFRTLDSADTATHVFLIFLIQPEQSDAHLFVL
jgi:hypothetical protein